MGRTGVGFAAVCVMLFVPTYSASVALETSSELPGGGSHLLPWHAIVKEINKNSEFYSTTVPDKTGHLEETEYVSGDSYCFEPEQAIAIKLPPRAKISGSSWSTELELTEWTDDLWLKTGQIGAHVEPSDKVVVTQLEGEGFFRLQYPLETKNGQALGFESYAIVSSDWKKDILAFCRKMKNEIETDPDVELYRCSIAASHLDHTMELSINTSFLSMDILKALADSVNAKAAFDSGKCPDFALGVNKIRLRRFPGGPITKFVLVVPSDYNSSRRWPLLVDIEGRYPGHGKSMIGLSWYGVSYKKIQWKEYERLLGIVKEKLNIDEDRIYLYGKWCAGISAMALALKYPDKWAGCTTLIGNSYRYLIGNALNLPFIFVQDEYHDTPQITGYCDFAVKCFEYYGCGAFKNSKSDTAAAIQGTSVPEVVRERNPERVLYTVESLDNPRAYWVKVIGRQNENFPGTIDARVDERSIVVRTSNIDAYRLDLAQAPIDDNKPVEIVENGESLGYTTATIFTKTSKKYAGATYIKNEHLHGPVSDAFTDPYVVVYGTSGNNKDIVETSKRISKSLAGDGPCFADTDLPEGFISSHNLILVGSPESHLWLSKITAGLPVQTNGQQTFADGKCYESNDMGLILIYPNPINPEKYVLVFSATSFAAMTNIPKAFTQMQSEQPADVGIFSTDKRGDIKWHLMEKFSTVWDWHDDWSCALARITGEHSKKQWLRWVARAVKEQLNADIAICEDHLKWSESVPAGQITYRDMFNSFRNDWFVKIQISGRSITQLLTLPFGDISKRELAEPIVDGVSLVTQKGNCGGAVLAIGDLEKEKKYTVALPYKAINGKRLGIAMRDYDIVGERWLVPLLKDYVCANRNLDIDAQLDCLKSDVF